MITYHTHTYIVLLFRVIPGDLSVQAYAFGKFDGILGLGFSSISIDGTPTVFENAIKQNIVDQPIFSFYLGDNGPGELTFGGYDPSKFEGDLEYVKLDAATYWQIKLDGISMGDHYHAGDDTLTAIVDSGTSLMVGPKSEVQKLARAVGATPNIMGEYTIDCKLVDDLPDLVISIAGKDYSLPGRDLVMSAQGTCLFVFMGMDFPAGGPNWILGDVFMVSPSTPCTRTSCLVGDDHLEKYASILTLSALVSSNSVNTTLSSITLTRRSDLPRPRRASALTRSEETQTTYFRYRP